MSSPESWKEMERLLLDDLVKQFAEACKEDPTLLLKLEKEMGNDREEINTLQKSV